MVDLDRFYMQAALQAAWEYQLLTYPNPAVGALIVKNGRLLSVAAHKEAGAAHAEVEAIKEAYYQLTDDKNILSISDAAKLHEYLLQKAKGLFDDATIYITLEPCFHYGKTPPCALLLYQLRFKRIVIATLDPNEKASGGAKYLAQHGARVEIGLCEEEANALLEPFIKWQKGNFVFFKLAQHLNGVISGGVISSLESRRLVHRVRSKIDLLVIGGGTVRADRPILDARLVDGRAPDLLIYSHQKDFDRSIPLFSKKRNIFIEDSLERIAEYPLVMIEGGEGMLEATRDMVDWYLHFVAPSCQSGGNYRLKQSMSFLHSRKIDRDLLIWSRNG